MSFVFLATIGAQIGSAFFNAVRGNKQSKELQRLQQEYQQNTLDQEMLRAREDFAQMCQLQREIDARMNYDRLQLIHSNSQTSQDLAAYSKALANWPLLVPPYVIKNSLPLFPVAEHDATRTIIPVNCIMTTSMDAQFNDIVFPAVEENLAHFCAEHWRKTDGRSIRFFQHAWKHQRYDAGSSVYNIHAMLKEVPTIVLCPVVRNSKLVIEFSWWGLSQNANDYHRDEVFDPELPPAFSSLKECSDTEIAEIIDALSHKLNAFISYFADMYYWYFYKNKPLLPSLCVHGDISMDANNKRYFSDAYIALLPPHTSPTVSPMVKCELIADLNKFENGAADSLLKIYDKGADDSLFSIADIPVVALLTQIAKESGVSPLKYSELMDRIAQKDCVPYCKTFVCADVEVILCEYVINTSPAGDSAIIMEWNPEKKRICCYDEDDFCVIGDNRFANKTYYQSQAFFLPKEWEEKRYRKLKVLPANLQDFFEEISQTEIVNAFPQQVSVDDVIEYVKTTTSDIRCCDVYYAAEDDLLLHMDKCYSSNILIVRISHTDGATTTRFLYFDSLEPDLKYHLDNYKSLKIE